MTASVGGTDDPQSRGLPGANARFRSIGPLFWFVLSVGYIGFLPYASGVMPFVGSYSIIFSESYAVAVAVSFLALATAWSYIDNVFAGAKPRLADAVVGLIAF